MNEKAAEYLREARSALEYNPDTDEDEHRHYHWALENLVLCLEEMSRPPKVTVAEHAAFKGDSDG